MENCNECRGPIGDDFTRVLISEGMGKDDTGQLCESGVSEYLFCSYKCVSNYFANWG